MSGLWLTGGIVRAELDDGGTKTPVGSMDADPNAADPNPLAGAADVEPNGEEPISMAAGAYIFAVRLGAGGGGIADAEPKSAEPEA